MTIARRLRAVLSVACLVVAAALAGSGARANDSVVLQLDWLPTGHHMGPYIGMKEGFFAAENIDLEVRRGTGAADSLTKVATGAAQFGYTDIANVMSTPNAGVKAIMSIDIDVPHAIIARGETGIKSFADLPGHTIGTAPTASSNLYMPLVLKNAGVDISKITIVNVDPSALAPMLLTKRVDGVVMWTTNLPRFKAEADKAGIQLVPLPFDIVDREMYGTVIIASEHTLTTEPDLTKRFLRALRRAFLYMRDHPDETAAYVHTLVPQQNLEIETISLKEGLKHVFTREDDEHTFGVFDPVKVKTTYSWIVRAMHVDPTIDPESFIDRRFFVAG